MRACAAALLTERFNVNKLATRKGVHLRLHLLLRQPYQILSCALNLPLAMLFLGAWGREREGAEGALFSVVC